MIASTLLFGTLVATLIALAVTGFQRVPTHQHCPECGERTQSIVPPAWLKPTRRWVGRRWCTTCNWQGLGRIGADLVPGRRIAHDSGFHWSGVDIGPDVGFQWKASREPEAEREPPDHPSGFRYAEELPSAPSDDPTGFRWSRREDDPSTTEQRVTDDPSGFVWSRLRADDPGFDWKRKADKKKGGFHWGGAV